jgi:TRAP-type C4-dicarboxylate transport system permease small subunit
MDDLMKLTHRLTRYGVWFGGGLICLSAFIVGFEVFIRKVFVISLGGADELSGFALAIGTAWALGFALLERAHIRIDAVYTWLPLPVRAVMDTIGLIVFFIFFGLLTLRGWSTFFESVALDAHVVSPLGTPLVYPQFLWVIGLTFLMAVTSLLLVRVLGRLIRRDFVGVQSAAGSKSVNEELEEELTVGKQLRGSDDKSRMPTESGR